MNSSIKQRIRKSRQQLRHRLSSIDALPQLTFIGIAVGLLVGGIIVIFRLLVEIPLGLLLPEHAENFEALDPIWHLLLPIIGAIVIAAALHVIPKKYHLISIGHVLERFHNHQGRMPLGNLFVQFFGGVLCLLSGQSVGREGPAVHIGASAASALGQRLKLPNNSLRTLVGCGVASAIAASFETPIAGVIFAMEVLMINYTIVGFIPIMMASVCGAIMTRLVFGEVTFFAETQGQLLGLWELSLMVVAGFIIGLFATLYMRLQLNLSKFSHYPVAIRIIAAGAVTGMLALAAPEILGLGYDTINLALEGQLAIGVLLVILSAKLLATAFSVSMGMPGGLIGPQLFIGACLGSLLGTIANQLFPDSVSSSNLYVLLGMAAMMGAVINAPLAALMAVVELTYNPSIIFPSLLIIVVACVTTRQLFKCEGIFVEQLAMKGKTLNHHPSQQALSSIGVLNAMNTAFRECSRHVSVQNIRQLLSNNPLWLIINEDHISGSFSSKKRQSEESSKENNASAGKTLLRAADLAAYIHLEEQHFHPDEMTVDLLDIPGQRFALSIIDERASLYEAQQALLNPIAEALIVEGIARPDNTHKILGVVTRNTIEHYYKI